MPLPKTFQLQTQRLRLRIPQEADLPHIFSATRYPGFNDGMLWEPPESMEELLAPLVRTNLSWEAGNAYQFTIERIDSGEFLGRISIRKTKEDHVWDIGFWTHPEHQGKGIMSEALGRVLSFGFEQLGATRIEACYALWNTASEKVLQKNGMAFVRYIEQGFFKHGKWVEENLVAIEWGEWNLP